jgi:hypothetical protein
MVFFSKQFSRDIQSVDDWDLLSFMVQYLWVMVEFRDVTRRRRELYGEMWR